MTQAMKQHRDLVKMSPYLNLMCQLRHHRPSWKRCSPVLLCPTTVRVRLHLLENHKDGFAKFVDTGVRSSASIAVQEYVDLSVGTLTVTVDVFSMLEG